MFINPNTNSQQKHSSEKQIDDNRFPTDGLKTLLKNSELLEVLLRPLSKTDQTDPQNNLSENNDLQLDIDLNFNEEHNTKSLFDWDNQDDLAGTKSNIDGDGTKCYGNAFLGQNLWDKNDLFQSEKFGVKFECLEIDEFLSENGLDETDVEFLDHIQKYEKVNSLQITDTLNNNLSSQSNNSLSSKSSRNDIQKEDQNIAISNLSVLNVDVSSNLNISNSQNQINKGNQQVIKKQTIDINNNEDSFKSGFDWNLDLNESTIDSISDYEHDIKTKNLNKDDLKPQPVMRKSKKFVPNELKDEKYWARRRKNNLAAKRSRDARRMKENQIALRASYLERENDNLRKQLEEFKRETKQLKVKLARYESNLK